MEINESGLTFSFDEDVTVVKFDDTEFYRKDFNKLPGAKGVDILAVSNDSIQFIEIKNCTGHEIENRWWMSIDNKKTDSAPLSLEMENRESLDKENDDAASAGQLKKEAMLAELSGGCCGF